MYVNLCNVVRNASVLFSVVPLSHNCGTKITLISINKAKSYQHLQMLKSVSVNDLAIDVFGCFRVLFSDAEAAEDVDEYVLAADTFRDRRYGINALTDVLTYEVSRCAVCEAFLCAEQGGAGI